jgi:hypothetical protein
MTNEGKHWNETYALLNGLSYYGTTKVSNTRVQHPGKSLNQDVRLAQGRHDAVAGISHKVEQIGEPATHGTAMVDGAIHVKDRQRVRKYVFIRLQMPHCSSNIESHRGHRGGTIGVTISIEAT